MGRRADKQDERLQPTVQVVTEGYDRELEKVSRALAVVTILGIVAIPWLLSEWAA